MDRSTLMEFSEGRGQAHHHVPVGQTGIPRDPGGEVSEALELVRRHAAARGDREELLRLPEELPEEAVEERVYCASHGLRSNLTIPLKLSGRPTAALAIGCFGRERQWPAELIPRIRLLGEVLLNALARRNQALCLQRALAEVRGLKAQLEEENLYLRKEINAAVRAGGGIVGESAAITRALEQARRWRRPSPPCSCSARRGPARSSWPRRSTARAHGASGRSSR